MEPRTHSVFYSTGQRKTGFVRLKKLTKRKPFATFGLPPYKRPSNFRPRQKSAPKKRPSTFIRNDEGKNIQISFPVKSSPFNMGQPKRQTKRYFYNVTVYERTINQRISFSQPPAGRQLHQGITIITDKRRRLDDVRTVGVQRYSALQTRQGVCVHYLVAVLGSVSIIEYTQCQRVPPPPYTAKRRMVYC